MEERLLNKLFDSLNNSGCGYCVLRNHETLPESLGGSDLDLAVLPEEEKTVHLLINEVVKEYGGSIILEYNCSVRVLRCLGCHQNEWWGLAVDLFSSIQYKGVEYISTDSLLDRSVDHKGIKVANNCDANTVALAKELLTNGKSRKDYFARAVELHASMGKNSLASLQESFDPETISYLDEMLTVGVEDSNKLGKLVSMMRHDVLARKLFSKIPAKIKNIATRCRRLVQPPGMCIAVLGTDGSGKTTMINAISPVLEQALHSKIQHEHLRPNWLPGLGVATRRKKADDNKMVSDPHAQKPSGFMGSLIRLMYYTIDYIAGYWLKVYPRIVKRPHLCLFDRYYYDFLLDPVRMKISLPKAVMRVAFLFAPQPRLIMCLGGDPEVIYARKPETSLKEVARQMKELQNLCAKNSRAVWINTDVGVEHSRHQILSAMKSSCGKLSEPPNF